MDLPVTLSNVVSLGGQQKISSRVSDPATCSDYYDETANAFLNGYAMSKYLVGISQSQACFADFLIEAVLLHSPYTIGKGLIALPADSTDPGAPTHLQVEKESDTYKVWIYFAAQRDALDIANDKMMYLTWTTVGDDTTGSFYWLHLTDGTVAEQPENLRVDFTRGVSTETNNVFIDFSAGSGFSGFRVDVSRVVDATAGTDKTYVKGRMELSGQPAASTLPVEFTYDNPYLGVTAILNADGAGAADWKIGKLANETDQGDLLNMGAFYMDISSLTYFDNAGTVSWIDRGLKNGEYINPDNLFTRSGTNLSSYLTCMEGTGTNCMGIAHDGLDYVGYFTDVCNEVDGAECTLYAEEAFLPWLVDYLDTASGTTVTNSAAADEPSDSRKTDLDAMTALNVTYADGETEAALFTTPTAP